MTTAPEQCFIRNVALAGALQERPDYHGAEMTAWFRRSIVNVTLRLRVLVVKALMVISRSQKPAVRPASRDRQIMHKVTAIIRTTLHNKVR